MIALLVRLRGFSERLVVRLPSREKKAKERGSTLLGLEPVCLPSPTGRVAVKVVLRA